jgi:hypothetical protein
VRRVVHEASFFEGSGRSSGRLSLRAHDEISSRPRRALRLGSEI